jgi:hypothetical protein
MRSVVVGRDYGGTLEIVSGLDDGALVATIGTQIFTEGQSVRFTVSTGPTSGTPGAATLGPTPAKVQR